MTTCSLPAALDRPPESVRMFELADRLLKSCTRKPVDVQRWVEWKRGRRDLSIEMLRNAVAAGGRRAYARAVLLQLLSDFVDDDRDVPSLEDVQRMAVDADCASDRARELAALDGMTDDERKELEIALTHEHGVIDLFLERLRRTAVPAPAWSIR